jgi:hypothetical protein
MNSPLQARHYQLLIEEFVVATLVALRFFHSSMMQIKVGLIALFEFGCKQFLLFLFRQTCTHRFHLAF